MGTSMNRAYRSQLTSTLALILLSGLVGLQIRAATIIVPTPLEGAEAGGGSSVLNDNIRLQEIYASSTLPAGPITITEIRFRPSAVAGGSFTSTIPNIQINLSTTSLKPSELQPTFAANVGPNDTVVFSGSLPLSSSFTGPVSGPKEFDIIIPLSTPFVYD